MRVKKTSGSTSTVYILSGSQILAVYVNGSLNKEYVYNGGRLLASISSAGNVTYHHSDQLSVRVSTLGQNQTPPGGLAGVQGHYPFGEQWYQSSGAEVVNSEFTNYYRDSESGNDYANARYYENRLGRFYSTDLHAGDEGDPQSLNRYAYAGNNPVNSTDPTGMDICMDNNCDGTAYGGGGDDWYWSADWGDLGTGDGFCAASQANCFGSDGPWGDAGGQSGSGAGIDACGVDGYCIANGGIGPFGSPVAQIFCDADGCMTGSWAFSQYNVGGTISVDWRAERASLTSYQFTGGDGSPLEQQKELAAIKLGEAACAGQATTAIAGCIQDAYDTLVLKAPTNAAGPLVGGNYNWDITQVVIQGHDVSSSGLGCVFGHCGAFETLHFHGDGTFHVDTANPWFIPVGTAVHFVADVLGGHLWWSGGIPR